MPDFEKTNASYPDEEESNYNLPMICCMGIISTILSTVASNKYLKNESIAMFNGFLVGIIFVNTQYKHLISLNLTLKWTLLSTYYPIVIMKVIYSCDTNKRIKNIPLTILIILMCYVPIYFTLGFITLCNFQGALLGNPINVFTIGILLGTHSLVFPKVSSDRTKHFEETMSNLSIGGTELCFMYMFLTFNDAPEYWIISELTITFIQTVIIAFVIGYVFALVLRQVNDDWENAIILIITATYGVYAMCDILKHWSVLGAQLTVNMLSREKEYVGRSVDRTVQTFFMVCEYYGTTLMIFIFSTDLMLSTYSHFTPNRVGVSIMLYGAIIGTRLFWLVVYLPILRRIQSEYNLKTVVAMAWCIKMGPEHMYNYYFMKPHPELAVTWFGLYLLVNTVNLNTVDAVLGILGFLRWSKFTESNIHDAMVCLMNHRDHHLSGIKMNRIFTDANWSVICNTTSMPNLIKYVRSKDRLKWLSAIVICPICRNTVTFDPNNKDINLFIGEIRIRILKALKVSFIRQYEQGYLNNLEITLLLQSVEIAIDTDSISLNYDQLCKFEKNSSNKCWRNCNIHLVNEMRIMPKQHLRSYCYNLLNKKIYQEFYLCMNLFCAFSSLMHNILFIESQFEFMILDAFFEAVFILEMIILVLSYSHRSVKDGLANYFRIIGNIISFTLLTIQFFDFVMRLIGLNFWLLTIIMKYDQLFRLVLTAMFMYVQETTTHAFPLAMALLTAYEEITDLLPSLVVNQKLHQMAKIKIDDEKLRIVKDMGIAEVISPYRPVKVKTKLATVAVFQTISNTIKDFKLSGLLEPLEYTRLVDALNKSMQLFQRTLISSLEYKHIVLEIPWIAGDATMIEYIHSNNELKEWSPGETVVHVGDKLDGIIVIIAGMFKLSYIPSERTVKHMSRQGQFPVKAYLRNTLFAENDETYLMVGNHFGELCLLTNRPYNMTITAHTESQTYFLPNHVVKMAMSLSLDPINGLCCRMWKSALINFIQSILRQNPLYRSMSLDAMNELLHRAIVPNLTCFKIVSITSFIQEVLVIEGVVCDHNTGDIFTAPCYIPRSTQLLFMETPNESIPPKLVMIPIRAHNAYKVIYQTEIKSQLVDHHDINCKLHVKYYHHVCEDVVTDLRRIPTAMSLVTLKLSFLSNNVSVLSLQQWRNCSKMVMKE